MSALVWEKGDFNVLHSENHRIAKSDKGWFKLWVRDGEGWTMLPLPFRNADEAKAHAEDLR
jgi:hypothetical protein